MKFSSLQKYILEQSYLEGGKLNRNRLLKFYENYKKPPIMEDQINIITKCVERLIDKELLIGYGIRAARKWFIKEVKLTGKGKILIKGMLSKQSSLPFTKKRIRNYELGIKK